MVGQTFGLWTVLAELDKGQVLAKCACGEEKKLKAASLTQHKSTMCRSCSNRANKRSHGASAGSLTTKHEHYSWRHMISRCHDPKNKDYKNYGARGIFVCDVWRSSFDVFLMHMGRKPGPEYTIDRIDSNKGYFPENCRWATKTQQNRNQRSNIRLTFEGETKVISEWAEDPRCTVDVATVYKRIQRGWNPIKALFSPTEE